MNNLTILKELCKLVKTFMNLQEDQVYIYNQKFLIPNDKRVYICIGQQRETIYSNNDYIKGDSEYINILKELMIVVNIYGYTLEVLERKDEIPMCFRSNLCERKMEEIDFKISRMPISVNNITDTVGTNMLYRFDYGYNLVIGNQKILQGEYYLFNNQKIFKE